MSYGAVAVVGPTAVGKSSLGIRLVQEFGGEIISADSRQVYRYMDIGTAKPTRAEQALVPHRMIDLVEPSEVYTAALYRAEAERVLSRLEAEGQPAFVIGGTGFYLQALLDGLSLPTVAPDPQLRAQLRREAEREGPEALWRRLQEADPGSAARIHPKNLPRTIRALEVLEKLGGPVPARSQGRERAALRIGLTTDRARLHAVANARVLSQVEAGLADETRLLLAMGYDPSSPALDGFAYRQMVAYLEGKMSLEEAIRDYQIATRRYIRRQMTWFRADTRIHWFAAEPGAWDEISGLVRGWLESHRP